MNFELCGAIIIAEGTEAHQVLFKGKVSVVDITLRNGVASKIAFSASKNCAQYNSHI